MTPTCNGPLVWRVQTL